MKKLVVILAVLVLLAAFAGCTDKPPVPSQTPSGTPADTGNEPNAWVVTRDAPVTDAETGKQAGTAYIGFALPLENLQNGQPSFSLTFLDEKGENVKAVKNYTIDTAYMEKKYVEPQAVIEIISVDMIEVKANGVFYNDTGEKLLSFNEEVGPFRYIQKSDKGYMLAIGMNVLFVREEDAVFIPVAIE